jgi:hypothetical protein
MESKCKLGEPAAAQYMTTNQCLNAAASLSKILTLVCLKTGLSKLIRR